MKSLISDSKVCPYCGYEETIGQGTKRGYYNYKCPECGKCFRSTFVNPQSKELRIHGIGITGAHLNIHARLAHALNLSAGDGLSFSFSKDGISIQKTKQTIFILYKKSARTTSTLCTNHSCLALAFREEFGVEMNESITLKINNMGIIKKGELLNRRVISYNYELFLSVRASGQTSFSAAIRDQMNLKSGAYVYLYEKEGKHYIFSDQTNPQTIYEKSDGFRVGNQGVAGFVNYFAVASSILAKYLCSIYSVETGTSFRIITSDEVEIDGIKMHQLLK